MLRLTTLGGVRITREGVTHPWIERGWQRGACFALLAANGARGIDRELLSTLVWPDSSDAAARHSLDEMLSRARRELDCKELFVGGSTVALNPDVLSIDVYDFDAAIANRHFERAVQLYQGPFVEGLRLSTVAEAERRVEVARARLAESFATALEHLALRATECDDHPAAARWWQRAVQENPLSGRTTKLYLTALVAAGEHARALAHVRVHQALLRESLDAAADPEIIEWERRLRAAVPALPPLRVPSVVATMVQSGRENARVIYEQRLRRAIGASYSLGAMIEEGRVMTSYHITRLASTAPAEVHVVNFPLLESASQQHFADTFERVASLSHPAIVPVLEMGLTDGLAWLISAPRPPQSLRDVLSRGRTRSLTETARVARGVARALAMAHARGVCHGDLRPKRIGIVAGEPMVSGFGLVTALGWDSGSPNGSTVRAMGSPVYQSPEQLFDGAVADVASDVYALGSIIYEMLAGEPPFGRVTGLSLVRRKMSEAATPLRSIRDTVPPSVDAAVLHCLQRAPGDRRDALDGMVSLEWPIEPAR